MPAPKHNKNAIKEKKEPGLQVNFYLSATDAMLIRRKLQALGKPTDDKAVRRYAREQSKNGIWSSLKDEMPPMIY